MSGEWRMAAATSGGRVAVVTTLPDQDSATGPELAAADRAYATVLRKALTGRYRAGERLTEARLTAELGLSRIPVREALKRLAAEGVIDLHRHRGATIRVTSREDMVEFFQVRSMLESNCAAAAAGRIREPSCDEHRDRMIAQMVLLRKWAEAGEVCGREEYAEHSQLFHQLIIDLSGNRLLTKIWDGLQMPVHRLNYFRQYGQPADFHTSIHDHARIGAAILAGDSRGAESIVREHTNRIAGKLHTLSDREFDLILNPGLTSSPPESEQLEG